MKLFMRFYTWLLIGIPVPLSGQSYPWPAALDTLVDELIRNNGDLLSMKYKIESIEFEKERISSWEPPQAGIEFFQMPVKSFPLVTKNNMETDYFIQQMIPWPGKTASMRRPLNSKKNMMTEEYYDQQSRMIREFKTLYIELFITLKQKQLNRENNRILNQWLDILQKQYQSGMTTLLDIATTRNEIYKLQTDYIVLEKQSQRIRSSLNAMLSRPDSSSIIPDTILAVSDIIFSAIDSVERALDNKAELKSIQWRISMEQLDIVAIHKEKYPDFMIKAMYKNMTGRPHDYWSVMLGVTLPFSWWSKNMYLGKIGEKQITIKSLQADLYYKKQLYRNEIAALKNDLDGRYQNVKLYENIILPNNQLSLQTAMKLFESGKSNYMQIMEIYRMHVMSQTDYWMHVMNYLTAMARLEEIAGRHSVHTQN